MSADLYQRVIDTVDLDLRGSMGMPWYRTIAALAVAIERHGIDPDGLGMCADGCGQYPCDELLDIARALGVVAPDGE